MARQRLLADEQWARLLALPSDERDVVRHCTLAPDELAVLATKRGGHNRLGYALLLCAMRQPGRVLDVGEVPPAHMVAYVARQVGADPADLGSYKVRVQTRREQVAELMRHHGFRAFGRTEAARAKGLSRWGFSVGPLSGAPTGN
jgi:TnpA family transposase